MLSCLCKQYRPTVRVYTYGSSTQGKARLTDHRSTCAILLLRYNLFEICASALLHMCSNCIV